LSETVITIILTSVTTLVGTLAVQYVLFKTQHRAAQAQETVAKEQVGAQNTASVLQSTQEIVAAASSMVTQYHDELLASRKETAQNATEMGALREAVGHLQNRLTDEVNQRRREREQHVETIERLTRELGEANERNRVLTGRITALETELMNWKIERRDTGPLKG